MLTQAQRTEIQEVAAEIAAAIRRELGLAEANTDMEYLATLPPKERQGILKRRLPPTIRTNRRAA